jgi:hypothetical protein
MRKVAIAAMLCALVAGCSVDELVLTEFEQQDLADNVVAAIEAYQALGEFALSVALGQEQLDGANYIEPSADNDWTGTYDYVGDQFPGGNGEMTMTFQVVVDGVPVNPYDTDFTQVDTLTMLVTLSFNGVSAAGAPLSMESDFRLDITAEEGTAASVTTNGAFTILHNAYLAVLDTTDFRLDFDAETQAANNATGAISGTIDVPNYAFDADVDITGQGDIVDFSARISGVTVQDSVSLTDLQS